MISCTHPSHLKDALTVEELWTKQIRGVRATALCKIHEELEAMETLDDGDPVEHGKECSVLHSKLSHSNVLDGCCGSKFCQIEAFARNWSSSRQVLKCVNERLIW
jgi:homocysteine S-methyltransferase